MTQYKEASDKFKKKYGLIGQKVSWILPEPSPEREEMKKSYQHERFLVYKMIQTEVKCVRCGCTDIRFLEINHKNGGGGKEQRENKWRGYGIQTRIFKKERGVDDLELLCRPCNHIHYLEMKYKEKIPLKVIFDNEGSQNNDKVKME